MLFGRWVRRSVAAALACCVCAGAAVAVAQVNAATGTLSGTAMDETGAAVSDVRITVTNDATATRREMTTGAEGTFTFPLLPAGQYTLRAEREGFSVLDMPEITVEANEKMTVRLELKVDSLTESVVVTAQKRGAERLVDVPVPMTVLEGARLVKTSQVLLRDYATSVPGLVVTPNYVGRQNLSIRGVSAVSLERPTVGIMIDDIPYGSSSNLGSSVPDLDPGDVAQVEVMRGPQGVLYGANSMGGLIRYATIEPNTERLSGQVTAALNAVRNGERPGHNLRASANVPLSDRAAVWLSGFSREDPGFLSNPRLHADGVNWRQSYGARASALVKPSGAVSLKLGVLYQRTDWGALDEAVVAPGLGPLEQNYLPGAGEGHRSTQLYSAAVRLKRGNLELASITGFGRNEISHSLDISFAFRPFAERTFGAGDILYKAPSEWTARFTQELRAATPIGRYADLLIGAFYTHEDSRFSALMDVFDPGFQFVGHYQNSRGGELFRETAIFSNVTLKPHARADIQIGWRLSADRLRVRESVVTGPHATLVFGNDPQVTPAQRFDDNVVTYLVTPRFHITSRVMSYARFASGYRPGGANANNPRVPVSYGADQTRNYEIGIKASPFAGRLVLDASLFYIDWRDIQFQARDTVAQTPYIDNGGAARSRGLEFAGTWLPRDDVRIDVATAYTDARLKQDFPSTARFAGHAGDRIPFNASWSGKIALEKRFAIRTGLEGFSSVAYAAQGDREGPFLAAGSARAELTGYSRLDFAAGLRTSGWTATVFANNATDELGVLDGGAGYFYAPARIYTKPRQIGISLTRTFR